MRTRSNNDVELIWNNLENGFAARKCIDIMIFIGKILIFGSCGGEIYVERESCQKLSRKEKLRRTWELSKLPK